MQPSERIEPQSPALVSAFRNERLEFACHAVIVSLVIYQAATFHALRQAKGGLASMDFLAFYVAGAMWRRGKAAAAYDTTAFSAALNAITKVGTMHWAYPPPAFLVGGALSFLPDWAAYLVFTLAGYGAFAMVVKRLAGDYAPGALALAIPAMIINARSGQTGFWIAAIQGAFLLAVLHRRRTAGLWLGLLALKPHLGVGLGVAALVQRQVRTLCLAAGAAAALGVAATLALGPAIWPTFLGGMHQASAMLLDRQFPLARMTSVFAFFAPAGLAPWQAMALHLCVLALALALVVYTHGREWPAHLFWASATFAGLLVSPYAYDYDLVILALIGGLILPDLCQEAGSVVLAVLLALCWLAAANLQLTSAQILYLGYIAEYHGKAVLISMSAPFLLAAAALCGFVLFRHRSLGRQLRAVRPRTIKRAGGDGR